MANIKIKFDTKKLEKDLNKALERKASQLKDLLLILKYSGYCASFNQWLGGAQITLTPEGINYFENEEEYKKMRDKSSININNLNANNSIITFGNVFDSNFNIDNSYKKINELINQHGADDKEELKQILDETKDYVDNILETKIVGKNRALFTRIGDHIKKHQWFYQAIVTFIGNTIIKVMSGQ